MNLQISSDQRRISFNYIGLYVGKYTHKIIALMKIDGHLMFFYLTAINSVE